MGASAESAQGLGLSSKDLIERAVFSMPVKLVSSFQCVAMVFSGCIWTPSVAIKLRSEFDGTDTPRCQANKLGNPHLVCGHHTRRHKKHPFQLLLQLWCPNQCPSGHAFAVLNPFKGFIGPLRTDMLNHSALAPGFLPGFF